MTGETSLHLPGDPRHGDMRRARRLARRRRALRVHLGSDVKAGLALPRRAIEA